MPNYSLRLATTGDGARRFGLSWAPPKLQPCCFYSARVGNHRVNKWLFYDQQLPEEPDSAGRVGHWPSGAAGFRLIQVTLFMPQINPALAELMTQHATLWHAPTGLPPATASISAGATRSDPRPHPPLLGATTKPCHQPTGLWSGRASMPPLTPGLCCGRAIHSAGAGGGMIANPSSPWPKAPMGWITSVLGLPVDLPPTEGAGCQRVRHAPTPVRRRLHPWPVLHRAQGYGAAQR